MGLFSEKGHIIMGCDVSVTGDPSRSVLVAWMDGKVLAFRDITFANDAMIAAMIEDIETQLADYNVDNKN